MSFSQATRKVTDAVGLTQKTRFLRFRTTFCKPSSRRGENGLMEECSRVIRAGEVVEVAADDAEMNDLVERFYAFEVTKTRDQKGRETFEGVEPNQPPKCGAPISIAPDPNSEEAQRTKLLERIADAIDRVEIRK